MVRRHTRTAEGEHHYGPAVGVISGNYVTGRRRGTVDGIDFGATGSGQNLHRAPRNKLYSLASRIHIILRDDIHWTEKACRLALRQHTSMLLIPFGEGQEEEQVLHEPYASCVIEEPLHV